MLYSAPCFNVPPALPAPPVRVRPPDPTRPLGSACDPTRPVCACQLDDATSATGETEAADATAAVGQPLPAYSLPVSRIDGFPSCDLIFPSCDRRFPSCDFPCTVSSFPSCDVDRLAWGTSRARLSFGTKARPTRAKRAVLWPGEWNSPALVSPPLCGYRAGLAGAPGRSRGSHQSL